MQRDKARGQPTLSCSTAGVSAKGVLVVRAPQRSPERVNTRGEVGGEIAALPRRRRPPYAEKDSAPGGHNASDRLDPAQGRDKGHATPAESPPAWAENSSRSVFVYTRNPTEFFERVLPDSDSGSSPSRPGV